MTAKPTIPVYQNHGTKPQAQPDGRIGQQPVADTPGPSTYDFMRDGISDGGWLARLLPGRNSLSQNPKWATLSWYNLHFTFKTKICRTKTAISGSESSAVIGKSQGRPSMHQLLSHHLSIAHISRTSSSPPLDIKDQVTRIIDQVNKGASPQT